MSNSDTVDCLFSEAYALIEQGLCYDEVNDKQNALLMYQKGLDLSQQAFELEKEPNSEKKENLSKTSQGLSRVKELVQQRIEEIKNTKNEEISKEKISEIRGNLNTTFEPNAQLYYWLPDGVQLVIIEGDKTNVPTPPSSLAIFVELKQDETCSKNAPLPPAFIQVGTWVYPLRGPQLTTVMKNELGIYVLPNPTREHPQMFVGIILPRNISSQLEKEFVYALNQFSTIKESQVISEMSQEQKQRTSERIAKFLIDVGDKLAVGATSAATKTGKYMADKGEEYRANLEPTEQPTNIHPLIQNGVVILHKGSKVVAKVTRFVLDKIGDVGVAIGQKVADSLSGDGTGGRAFRSTATVVGGGITAFSTIWISLEEASKTLIRCISDETVQTVNLRYGPEASQTTHHALHALGHTTLASFQIYEFGPRSIAGRMARKAGLQIVQGFGTQTETKPNVTQIVTKEKS
uniref:MIT domain-containing protein n=1 Tax=Meloidogyne javanica TaxID=6303 RepID=A0A915MQ87_MELJA